MTVYITFTIIGTDAGPFNLYSNVDGYSSAFEVGITKTQLLIGFSSSNVPIGTTTIRIKSFGVCTNFVDLSILPVITTTTTTIAPTTTSTTTSSPTTTTSTTLAPTTTTTTTEAGTLNFLIDDCGGAGSYAAPIGGSGLGLGDVISYRPIGSPSALPRCGTIMSVTFVSVADATITGPSEGISRDCGDNIHCDLA